MISEQAKERMRALASRYPVARSALLPALHIAQEEEGYITDAALEAVAEALQLTTDDVKSVATFYTMYYERPHGQKVVSVCTGISCYLRGCDELVDHLKQRLGIEPGETTPDGMFTLACAECLASCGTAPVLQVNGEFVEHVTPQMADDVLAELTREVKAKGRAPLVEHSDGKASVLHATEERREVSQSARNGMQTQGQANEGQSVRKK